MVSSAKGRRSHPQTQAEPSRRGLTAKGLTRIPKALLKKTGSAGEQVLSTLVEMEPFPRYLFSQGKDA